MSSGVGVEESKLARASARCSTAASASARSRLRQPRPASASLGQPRPIGRVRRPGRPNSARLVFGAGFGDDGFEESRVGKRERARWGLVYEDGVAPSEVGTPVHALELAHAAKFNLGTSWGVGDSCVPGPDPHRRTGQLAGSGYVAVAGPHAVRSK